MAVRAIDINGERRQLTFRLADDGDPAFDAIAAERRLRAAAEEAGPDLWWEVVTRDEPRRRLAAMVTVPALGWAAIRPVAAAQPPPGEPLRRDDRTLDNGLVSVTVADDGTLSVTADGVTVDGVARLVDGGDGGDSYNYAPPVDDVLVDTPTEVTLTAPGEVGPVVGRLRVERRYELPTSSDLGGRSTTTESTLVVMHVEVRAGEPFVRLALEWENRSRDHRLRLHVPTARPADGSHAKGQLAVVRRGRTAQAGPVGEYPIPTFPAETFVDAGGVGVVLARTMEYEVVDAAGPDEPTVTSPGTEIALTLLRSVAYLSRNVHPYRSEPAGPQVPTPAAQVLGPCRVTLAVVPHRGDWAQAGLGGVAEAILHPVVVRTGAGAAGAPLASVEGLRITGAGVDLLSLRRRNDDNCAIEVRVVNASDETTTAGLGSSQRAVQHACTVSGRGVVGDPVKVTDGAATLPLGPWQIATVRLDLGVPFGA